MLFPVHVKTDIVLDNKIIIIQKDKLWYLLLLQFLVAQIFGYLLLHKVLFHTLLMQSGLGF